MRLKCRFSFFAVLLNLGIKVFLVSENTMKNVTLFSKIGVVLFVFYLFFRGCFNSIRMTCVLKIYPVNSLVKPSGP